MVNVEGKFAKKQRAQKDDRRIRIRITGIEASDAWPPVVSPVTHQRSPGIARHRWSCFYYPFGTTKTKQFQIVTSRKQQDYGNFTRSDYFPNSTVCLVRHKGGERRKGGSDEMLPPADARTIRPTRLSL
jgi:hypothetical protein